MLRLIDHLQNGARQAGELRAELSVDRSTLTRAYQRDSERILRLGRARATRYAARQTYPGLNVDEFHVFRIDEVGNIARAGQLVTLVNHQSVWLPDETIIDGLPPEFYDIAPQGFLGRSYARRHTDLGLPDDVSQWSDHHVLIALSRRGEDLPGNLVIGRDSFDRWYNLRYDTHTIDDFPALAEAALAGEHTGSSAGGEQPKFTALVAGRHQLVKFANDRTDNARRWQDLLTLEHVALRTLDDAGIASAETALHFVNGFRCLAVDRFDRIGLKGRRAVLTLGAATEQSGIPWTDAALQLATQGALGDFDTQRIALLDAFGALIANTDRHLYNILLYPTDHGYSLAPVFDQLPMAYAPPASGNMRTSAIDEANPSVNTLDIWSDAQSLARKFWRRASELPLSDSMSAIVAEHASR